MTEPTFDKDLELVKLQIAADALHAELQAYGPTYFILAFALLTIAYSIMPQMGWVLFLVFIVSIVILGYLAYRLVGKYNNGIIRLDEGIEDFKAGKPLDSLATLWGSKKKK